jgi:hypothetical protein
MTQILWIVVVLALLLLWRLAWRSQPLLAVGIGIGVLLGWVVGVTVEAPSLEDIPIWLPPLPFAIVAAVLFFFGILAWFWGDDRTGGDSRNQFSGSQSEGRPDASSSH